MTRSTQPVFIVGSGRSGTRTFFRMLCGAPGVEIHHEYAVSQVQKLAAMHFMGVVDQEGAVAQLAQLHGAAVHWSQADRWLDSSNKLSWLIGPLARLFPSARFLALVRDGRKVVPSFYYKLREEMYDDQSCQAMMQWLKQSDSLPAPPPEKRYWWNVPKAGQPFHEEFPTFDRFQRVAYHWAESNRVILDSFSRLPAERTRLVRLEDLRHDSALLRETIEFLGVPFDDTFAEYIQTPRNVFFPLDFQLTRQQLKAFDAICAPTMRRLGYDQREVYRVEY